MKRDTAALACAEFDLLVIGGGITGAFVAWDASLRGLKTALIEKADFGGATSAASSKLLHGGVRYLQQAAFHKVRESALERAHFQYLAPHQSHYVPFLVPTYRRLMKSMPVLASAMVLYEALCLGEKGIIGDARKYPPPVRRMGRAEVIESAPYLERPDLTGAIVLPESHMHSSERMTLAVVKSAVAAGATVANYTRADGLLRRGSAVCGAAASDILQGERFEIRARMTVNAGGPWIPLIEQRPGARVVTTGYARGAHIVVESLRPNHAVALPTAQGTAAVIDRGGRHVFIIPWRERALIGTSYSGYEGDLDGVTVQPDDVQQLLDAVNGAAPGLALKESDVSFAFCGLYPLQASDIKPGVYQGTGEYQIFDHAADDGVSGLITALGAKFTTARTAAERTVDLAQKQLRLGRPGPATRGVRCVGGDIDSVDRLVDAVAAQIGDRPCARHLVTAYGTEATKIASTMAAGSLEFISRNQHVTPQEIDFILEHEMAQRLEDVIFRRTGLGTIGHPGDACIGMVAERLAVRDSWSALRRTAEIDAVRSRLRWRGVAAT